MMIILRILIKHLNAKESHNNLDHSIINRQKYTIIVAFFLHFCAVEKLKKHSLRKNAFLNSHNLMNLIV